MDKKDEIQEVSTVKGAVSEISTTNNDEIQEISKVPEISVTNACEYDPIVFETEKRLFLKKNIPVAISFLPNEAHSDGCKSQKVMLSFSKVPTDKLLDLLQESLTDVTRTFIEEELTTRGVVIQKDIKLENIKLGNKKIGKLNTKMESLLRLVCNVVAIATGIYSGIYVILDVQVFKFFAY